MNINEIYKPLSNIVLELSIICIISTIIILTIIYLKELRAFKNSAYGKQTTQKFWNIINDKGARGEYRVSQVLEKTPFEHKMIFNCYIPNRKGDKTELDIIMISKKGIFVVENKNYSGWIFGDEKSKNWCQTIYNTKNFFYNPVKQNRSHIKNLENMLKIGEDKYVSVITFNRNANLKKIHTESENLFVLPYNKISDFFKNYKRENCLTTEEIEEIYQKLIPGTQLTSEEKKAHVERIKKEYNK